MLSCRLILYADDSALLSDDMEAAVSMLSCRLILYADDSALLSDGGRWSKMKVGFSVSSQSILKELSRNVVSVTIII